MGESSLRDDIKEACSIILYKDKTYLIGKDKRNSEAHNLVMGNECVFLGRNILYELAMGDAKNLESSLINIGATNMLNDIRNQNIPLESLGWALAKAYISERVIEISETYGSIQ